MVSAETVDELREQVAREAPDEPALADLAAGYFASVPPGDRADSADEVLAAVRAHLSLARLRVPGRPVTAVLNLAADDGGAHPERTEVLVVADDMPYLIDSVLAELARGGATVHRVIHPVVVVRRDADGRLLEVVAGVDPHQAPPDAIVESWMNLELSDLPGSSPARDLGADLHARLTRVLADVAAVDRDTDEMAARARAAADALADAPSAEPERAAAAEALLRWCAEGNLTFLGYRYDTVVPGEDGVAGRDPGPGLGVLRSGSESAAELLAGPDRVPPDAPGEAGTDVGGTPDGGFGAVAVVTRASARSTVHQPVHPLYLAVVDRDRHGAVHGEHRILGMLSVAARHADVLAIPVVERRVREVLERAGLPTDSWSGRRLLEVLQTYPRAELLCTDRQALEATAGGVLALADRRRVRLFLRRDRYGCYFSAMIYLPRDRYTTATRLRMGQLLLDGLRGRDIEYSARVTEDQLALVHVTVFTGDDEPVVPDVDALTGQLAEAALSWTDRLREAATPAERAVLATLGEPFGQAYQEDFGPDRGLADIRILDGLAGSDDVAVRLHPPTPDVGDPARGPGDRRLTLYLVDRRITLSAVLPVLASLGVEVVDERPYEVRRSDGTVGRINDFGLRLAAPEADGEAEADLQERFADAFRAAWHGRISTDAFNALVLRAGMTWRQAAVLRALARYLRQIGSPYGQGYVTDVVGAHQEVATGLVRLFEARFDPALDPADRDVRAQELDRDVEAAVAAVPSLDADRILRAMLGIVRATLRTNYFRRDPAGTPREVLALKLDPERVPGVPAPRPAIEMFVHGARVEGVHLRFGAVARGGLRWSDRRQDYRTEILGLVKAQSVKNAVIVPVGAKGGFVVKRLPAPTGDPGADRDAQRAEGVACYRMFVGGLLDLVDDRAGHDAGAAVRTPADVVRYDGDDSYLVVAADKGTAGFSDIANEVAGEYGFWLGDAFASGGSVGYDHKAMGITARGAWESVRRHLRELGRDVAVDPVTVVGVGDMAGDVFGNGMLLSEHLRVVAAFDHRHVFLDPDPDPAASYAERRRLFDLPRSSWADYDTGAISAGGGIWPRTAKTVPVSAEAAAALGIAAGDLDPTALVRAVLCAPADLLWNGGVGTYVKASVETHADVGDKSNDAVRVDAAELRVAVVGEGGNLGLTQLGRIEFARGGGKVNTDAVDNSAGVDCSDHEVNIKILLDALVERGELAADDRDHAIGETADAVADLVLRDNVAQNELLGVARAHAPQMVPVHADLVAELEERGRVDRELDVLPGADGFAALQAAGEGLTSPELSTLMAHVKLDLTDALAETDLPDADVVGRRLPSYFPATLATRFPTAITAHPLRRQILATMLSNEVVDGGGITYVHRLTREVSATPGDAVRAYQVVNRVFGLDALAADVDAARLSAALADRLTLAARRLLDRAARWFLTLRPQPLAVGAETQRFSPAVSALAGRVPDMLRGEDAEGFAQRCDELVADGAPRELARRAESALSVFALLDVVEIAEIAASRDEALDELDDPVGAVAELYFALSEHLGLGRLLTAVAELDRADRWDALARLALRDELYSSLRAVTLDVLADTEVDEGPDERIERWEEANASRLLRARASLAEIAETGRGDLATVSVAARRIRSMVR